ncbi:MAG: DUF6807 family protein [Gemmataceae bacterium]
MCRAVLVALLLILNAAGGRADSKVTFERSDAQLRITVGGKPLATYVWRDPAIARPYFAQVHAPNGRQVTRNHPPVPGKDATDHATMHPGVWLAFGDLGGADFWRNKGRVEHVEFVEPPTATREGGRFSVRNRYRVGDKTLCEEVCRIGIQVQPGAYLIDWTSEFRGPADFTLGDQEEMGLGVRVATDLTVKAGGRLRNSTGSTQVKEIWGRQALWCDYSGGEGAQAAGVALFPDPRNVRPSWFHARDYGLLVANPFGRNAFTRGERSAIVVRKGETFRLRFGILVHAGKTDLAAAYRRWTTALPWIEVARDKRGFVKAHSGEPFVPWGFNYDHDEEGRLLEDYWEKEWGKIEAAFAQMKKLGATVVRIHLQVGRFMERADQLNPQALDRLEKLVELAEQTGLYLNLTGLGCYHKKDVPAWYDSLSEADRWAVQARFWQGVARRCARHPAVFCYDLMNEPVVPGGQRKDGDWLGPAFAGKHFVQFITLDQKKRPRPQIARQWIDHLVSAIRAVDERHLVTVGLVDWSLDRPGLTSGFVPGKVTERLDFICVHLYPQTKKLDEASKTLAGFAVGKPIVVEETFPLACSAQELDSFIERHRASVAGWISFYWGKDLDALRRSRKLGDAILLDWLGRFERRGREYHP